MGRFGLASLGQGGFMEIGTHVLAYPCFRYRITGHYFTPVTLTLPL